ncbi:MAG: hypothetical protein H6719_09840 [Sandaracinaceae bacterium]|nr:hypothetical protein [Sandaracinaceae bacterium]
MSDSMTRRLLRSLIPAGFVLAMACGGGAAEEEPAPAPAATTAGDEGGDPTEGGRRRAAQGAACDHGGSADRTCQRGLFCCYQDAPSAASGTCIPTDDCTG